MPRRRRRRRRRRRCRVEEILPNADGFYQDWTRDVPGSDHFGRVNENPPDGDATFVYDNVLNTKDTYTFPSITPASGSTIYACAVNFHTKKLESGFRGLSAIARLGGVDGNGTESRITTDYNIHQSIMERDPNGDAWTVNNVNASEFGPEITT